MSDAAVKALARVIHDCSPLFGWDALSHDSRYRYRVRAAAILDHLAATLHDDTEEGQALRERLGLSRSVNVCYQAGTDFDEDGRPQALTMSGDPDRIANAIEGRLYGMSPETHRLVRQRVTTHSIVEWGEWEAVDE